MSRQVAKLVYDRKIGSMLRKAVLAYFAERANDDGSMIWASKQTIADEIECSKQAVINTVKQFLDEGILKKVGQRKTQGGFTVVYDMDLSKIAALPTAKESTPLTGQNMDQSTPLTEPVNPVDPDQSTPLTQTVLEPSLNRPIKKQAKKAEPVKVQKPDDVSDSVWRDWLVHRKTAFSETALAGFRREAGKAGWSLEQAITEAIERGWQGFKADWVKEKQNGTANRTSPQNGKTADGWSSVLRDVANRSDDGDRDHNAGPVRGPPRLGFGPS